MAFPCAESRDSVQHRRMSMQNIRLESWNKLVEPSFQASNDHDLIGNGCFAENSTSSWSSVEM